MSYENFYRVPISVRRWLIKRIIKDQTPQTSNTMDDMDVPLSKL
jgi:hypothetical protein